MAREKERRDYSEDEIEQILGKTAPETKLALKEIEDTIRENPLLVTALVFAFGILVGSGLSRGRKRNS
jgi:hypothetical protein